MTHDSDNSSIIVEFVPSVPLIAPTRDELAHLVRSVLAPVDLFKMSAQKARKKNAQVEIIDFAPIIREEKNG
jgi:hypothetical protein